jgi:hypothetical protein
MTQLSPSPKKSWVALDKVEGFVKGRDFLTGV